MDDRRVGRALMVLRQRRGWRQVDVADRAGVSRSAVSDLERGRLERYTIATVRRVLASFDAWAQLDVMWAGRGELDRLLDADHARLMRAWAERHHRSGWEVWVEASYSIGTERGRVDALAFHPPTATLEVVEGKTGIWDVQDTLGRLDAKVRLGPRIAAQRGWRARRVVGALVVAEGRTARRRISDHRQLFARYAVRGRSALAWVRDPRLPVTGLLVFVSLPNANHGGLRRAGQRRVRVAAARRSVDVGSARS